MAKKQAQSQDTKAESKPNPIVRFIRYVEACRAELRKVTWPTWKETRKATFAVLGFVAIMAIILGLIDLGLSSLIKAILA
ncbi:MAG: preprotein translocase subunit SecE [Desulfovibrio sp.]|nr:preprotein translocase subunit SecE [Desulfovibrio sp.]